LPPPQTATPFAHAHTLLAPYLVSEVYAPPKCTVLSDAVTAVAACIRYKFA